MCCEKTPPPPPCECSSLAGMECVKPDQCGVATQETSSFVIKQVLGLGLQQISPSMEQVACFGPWHDVGPNSCLITKLEVS